MNVNQQPPEVYDRDSAIRFVHWCLERLGLGYHRDTAFADYVDRDNRPVFSAAQAGHFDALTQQAFVFCDPYEIGAAEFCRLSRAGWGHGVSRK